MSLQRSARHAPGSLRGDVSHTYKRVYPSFRN